MTQNHGITPPFLGNMDRNPANLFPTHSAWHPAAIDSAGHRGEMPAVWMSNTAHPLVRDQNAHTDKDAFRAASYPYANYYKSVHGSHNAPGAHNMSNTHDARGMSLASSVPMVHGMQADNSSAIPPAAHGLLGIHGGTNSLNAQQNGHDMVTMGNMRQALNLPGNDGSVQMPGGDRSIAKKKSSKSAQPGTSAGKTVKKPRTGADSTSSKTADGQNSGDGSGKPVPKKVSQGKTGPDWKNFISNLRTNPYEMPDSYRHHMDPDAPVQPEVSGKSDEEPASESASAADTNSKEARKKKVLEAKEALNRGQEHINAKGKLIRARKMGDGCSDKGCRFKCEARISIEARRNIFNYFWNLGNHQLQWLFIAMHTSVRAPKQRTQDPNRSRRKTSRSYFFRQGIMKIPVCKTMFLQTLDVSDSWVDTAISKAADGIAVAPDCRGRHTKSSPRSDNEGEPGVKKKRQRKKKKGDVTDDGAGNNQVSDAEFSGNIAAALDLHGIQVNRVMADDLSNTSHSASSQNNSNADGMTSVLRSTEISGFDAADSEAGPSATWNTAGLAGPPNSACPVTDPGEVGTEPGVEAVLGDDSAEQFRPHFLELSPLPPKPKKRKRADVSAALGAAASGMGVGVGGMLAATSVPDEYRHLLDPMTLGLRDLPNGAVVTPFSNSVDGLTVAPPPPLPPPPPPCPPPLSHAEALRKHKRMREPARWKATQCKAALNMGKEHVNLKGKLVRARRLGEGCVETCRYRCRDRIDDTDRESIFTHFWGLGDHRLQWLFISRHTRVREPKHRTTSVDPEHSRRKTSRSYFFTVFRPASMVMRKRPAHLPDYPVEVEVPVCKTMFLRTLDVSDSWVESAICKVHLAQGEDTYELTDKRGRHKKKPRRVPEHIIDSVKQHTSMFPRSGVPPPPKGFKRKCLADGHSVTKMYRMYLEWMAQRQPQQALDLQQQQQEQQQQQQQQMVMQQGDQGDESQMSAPGDQVQIQMPKKRPARTVASLRQYRDILSRQLRAEFNIPEEEEPEEEGEQAGAEGSEKDRSYGEEMGSEAGAEGEVQEMSYDHEGEQGEEETYDGEGDDEGDGEEYLALHPKCEMIQGEPDPDVEW